jgi:hypothetical protein
MDVEALSNVRCNRGGQKTRTRISRISVFETLTFALVLYLSLVPCPVPGACDVAGQKGPHSCGTRITSQPSTHLIQMAISENFSCDTETDGNKEVICRALLLSAYTEYQQCHTAKTGMQGVTRPWARYSAA